jgi:hypothetical protein
MDAQSLVESAAGHGEVIWPARARRHFRRVATATTAERTTKSTAQLTDSIPGLRPHIPLWEWRWWV